jgi:hypothetical protein
LAITSQVKELQKFSLEVDSCHNIRIINQVAIFVKYVQNGIMHEQLLPMYTYEFYMYDCQKTVLLLVKTALHNLVLDIKNIISSDFDGSSNLSGRYNYCQTGQLGALFKIFKNY